MGDLKSHFENILNGGAPPRPVGTTVRPAASDTAVGHARGNEGVSSVRIRVCIVVASILILIILGYMLRKPTPRPEEYDFVGDEVLTNRKDLREREPASPRVVMRIDPLFQAFDD